MSFHVHILIVLACIFAPVEIIAADERRVDHGPIPRRAQDQVPVDHPAQPRIEASHLAHHRRVVDEAVEVDIVARQARRPVERCAAIAGQVAEIVAHADRRIADHGARIGQRAQHHRQEPRHPAIVRIEIGDERARELDIPGRSGMSKEELLTAIEAAVDSDGRRKAG